MNSRSDLDANAAIQTDEITGIVTSRDIEDLNPAGSEPASHP